MCKELKLFRQWLILNLIFLMVSLPFMEASAQASPAVIYQGSYGKIIPGDGLRFRDGTTLSTGATDPTVTAFDAPFGSLYVSTTTGLTYQKQDAGSTTNWNPLYFVPLFTDDNRLVRTNGTDDVQQSGVTVSDTDAISGVLSLSTGSATVTGLTQNAVAVPDATGLLGSTGVLVNATNEVSGATKLDVDDVRIDGFTVSTTALNQNLLLDPNGTGEVEVSTLPDSGSAVFTKGSGELASDFPTYRYSTLDQLLYVPGLQADNVKVDGNTISSTDLNGNLVLAPNGTGEVQVAGLAGSKLLESTATGGITESIATTADIQGKLDKFPAETTDNKVVRTDTNGNTVQGSLVEIDDLGAMSGLTDLTVDNLNLNGNTLSSSTGDVALNPTGALTSNQVLANEVLFGNGTAQIGGDPSFLYKGGATDKLTAGGLDLQGDGITPNTLNADLLLDANGTGSVNVENVNIKDNAVSASVLNDDLDLAGNGTGRVHIDRAGTLYEAGTRNPEYKELLADPSFEVGASAWSCDNAVATQVAGGPHGDFQTRINITTSTGFCELVSPVSGDKANQEYLNKVRLKTLDTGVTAQFRDGTRVVKEIPMDYSGDYFFDDVQMIPTTSVALRVSGTIGDEVFVDDAGHTLGGHPTFESVFKKTVDVTLTNSGAQNLTGTLRVSRIGDQVIITSPSGLTHDSSNNATSASGILPEWAFTGTETFSNSYFSTGDEDRYFQVLPGGGIQFTYQISSTGAGLIRTSTAPVPTISYNLNDEYSTPDTIAAVGTTDFKTVTKTLSSTVVSSGDISALTFTGLEVGANYLLTGGAYLTSKLGNIVNLNFRSGSSGSGDVYGSVRYESNSSDDDTAKFSPAVRFKASSSSLFFNASANVSATIVGGTTNSATNFSLTKIPDTANLVAELSDTLKYENAGPMIGGYASFGGATDGSVCSASPCTKHREIGGDGVSITASRSSTGNYTPITAAGFEPGSAVNCFCTRADNGGSERQCETDGVSLADGSGVVSLGVLTTRIDLSGHTLQDTFFTIYCVGPRP